MGENKSGSFGPLGYITGGISAAGNLFTSLFNGNQQRKENERNRRFSAEQAALQRSWQEKMIAQYQDYNSPSAQMKRLEDAGLNPNLAYGSLQDTTTSSAPSGASASGSGSFSPVASPFGDPNSSLLSQAQARLLNSQADKLESETSGQEIQNAVDSALKESRITIGNLQVEFEKLKNQGQREQVSLLAQNVKNAAEEFKYVQSQIAVNNQTLTNMKTENAIKELDRRFLSDTYQSRVTDLASKADISQKEAQTYMARFYSLMALQDADRASKMADVVLKSKMGRYLDAQTMHEYIKAGQSAFTLKFLMPKQSLRLDYENEQIKLNLDSDKTWKGVERGVGVFESLSRGVFFLSGGARNAQDLLLKPIETGSKVLGSFF